MDNDIATLPFYSTEDGIDSVSCIGDEDDGFSWDVEELGDCCTGFVEEGDGVVAHVVVGVLLGEGEEFLTAGEDWFRGGAEGAVVEVAEGRGEGEVLAEVGAELRGVGRHLWWRWLLVCGGCVVDMGMRMEEE